VKDSRGDLDTHEYFIVFDPALTNPDALGKVIRSTPNMMGAQAGLYEPHLQEVLKEKPAGT